MKSIAFNSPNAFTMPTYRGFAAIEPVVATGAGPVTITSTPPPAFAPTATKAPAPTFLDTLTPVQKIALAALAVGGAWLLLRGR